MLRKYEEEIKQLKDALKGRGSGSQDQLMALDEQRKRAEMDKIAAESVLEETLEEYKIEKEERELLQNQLERLQEEMQKMQEVPSPNKEYQTRMEEIQKERAAIVEDKAQVISQTNMSGHLQIVPNAPLLFRSVC